MNTKGALLLCEEHPEVEQLISGLTKEFGLRLVSTSNPAMVSALAEEHRPRIIILNTPFPEPVCHQLKMNSALYHIPLFVIAGTSDRDIELRFLSNEFFPKPLETIAFLDRLKRYIRSSTEDAPEREEKTGTRERWIEKKTGGSYCFEFRGHLGMERMDVLISRIGELITVGRKDFTINLLAASGIENIPLSLFTRLQEIILRASGHLKIISHLTPITEELSMKGIDIDEYMDLDR